MNTINKYNQILIETKTLYDRQNLNIKPSKYNLAVVTHRKGQMDASCFSVDCQPESSLPLYTGFEKFSLKRLKVISCLFIDILETHDLNEETRKWYELNYKRISTVLELQTGSFCTSEYLYALITYKQTKKYNVGRMYAGRAFAYTNLPREIRALLINSKEYRDFDMVNSHPTLLLEYARKNMKGSYFKLLVSYVTDREEFLAKVSRQMNCSRNDAKTQMLKVMNFQKETAESKGGVYLEFWEECNDIREHIYKTVYTKGSAIYLYFEQNKKFRQRSLPEQKVSVQSIYLQSRETDYVYQLMKSLRERVFLEGEPLKGFADVMVDRHVDIDNIYYHISFVPMYDGLLVGSEDGVTLLAIPDYIIAHNQMLKESGSLVQFAEKDIVPESKHVDLEMFRWYEEVLYYVDSLTPRQLNRLFRLLSLEHISFAEVSDIKDILQMKRIAKEFRRKLFRRLLEVCDEETLVLNDDLLTQLGKLYGHLLGNDKDGFEHGIGFLDLDIDGCFVSSDDYELYKE